MNKHMEKNPTKQYNFHKLKKCTVEIKRSIDES